MQNPRLAGRYAKSLLDLSVEQDSLEVALEDMQTVVETARSSPEFAAVLRSPVIKGGKKQAIVDAVLPSLRPMAATFIKLLISKGREMELTQIAAAFIQQYKDLKGVRTVRLTTAAPVSDAFRQTIQDKLVGAVAGGSVDLTTAVDEKLIGGFVLETDDTIVDASIRRDLQDIKKNFLGNLYVQNIR